MAKKLHKAKIWSPNKRTPRNKATTQPIGPVESRRVNIVSEKLCGEHPRMEPSMWAVELIPASRRHYRTTGTMSRTTPRMRSD